jgi:hypothetical protein
VGGVLTLAAPEALSIVQAAVITTRVLAGPVLWMIPMSLA